MTAASIPADPTLSDEDVVRKLASASSSDDARELIALTPRLCAAGRPNQALVAADAAIRIAAQDPDKLLRIQALRARARAQSELTDYRSVVQSLLEAQSLNRALDSGEEERCILSSLGLAYGKLGVRADAIAAHEAALALARGAPEAAQSECIFNLGVTLVNCERPGEALTYFERALTIAERSADRMATIRARINLNATRATAARMQLRRGEVEAATEELRRILADCEVTLAACNDIGAEGFGQHVLQHIGIVRKDLGDLASARACLDAVCAYARKRDWKRLEMDSLLNVGGILARTGQFDEAERVLDTVLEFYRAAEYKTSIIEAHLERAHMHELAGRLDRAYAEMRDSERVRLKMAADEERLRVTLRAWREEAERQARVLASANEALAEENRTLDHEARHDALTGLPNRRFGDAWLGGRLVAKAGPNPSVALAIIDVDHFKTINDRFSHPTGDAVLAEIAAILRANCRSGDIAIRQGGDEFALAFPDTTAEHARAIAERVRDEVARHDWNCVHPSLAVTITIGVADSSGIGTVDALLRAADARLYEGKTAGRNLVA